MSRSVNIDMYISKYTTLNHTIPLLTYHIIPYLLTGVMPEPRRRPCKQIIGIQQDSSEYAPRSYSHVESNYPLLSKRSTRHLPLKYLVYKKLEPK